MRAQTLSSPRGLQVCGLGTPLARGEAPCQREHDMGRLRARPWEFSAGSEWGRWLPGNEARPGAGGTAQESGALRPSPAH